MITKGETYIIGEIGQNHNGSVDIAKLIVELIARPVHEDVFGLNFKPMNAVKMTRRDLNEELTTTQMNRPYVNNNSFGALMASIVHSLSLTMKLILRFTSLQRRKDLILLKHFVPKAASLC